VIQKLFSGRQLAIAKLQEGLRLEDANDLQSAFTHFQTATELDPQCGPAWRHLGNLLRLAGDLGPASACFDKAIASGDDPELNEFFPSAVGVGPPFPKAPRHFVQALFNEYAKRFEAHLTEGLRYQAPQMLYESVVALGPRRFGRVLDLGCGTGLAAREFQNCANYFVGVDLSNQMLAHALARNLYAELVQASIEDYLAASEKSFDLIVCCDVLIYTGNLLALFAGVSQRLRPNGYFALTIEITEAEAGFDLLPNLRYAHSERYVQQVAQSSSLQVVSVLKGPLRLEQGAAVEGAAFVLCLCEKDAADPPPAISQSWPRRNAHPY
jgi:predicted TPR repeat methyltransferase